MTTKLIHWLKSDLCQINSCIIEIKMMRGSRWYLSSLKEHQLTTLKNVRNKIVWKIPDCGYLNPADIMYYKKGNGYLCVIKDKTAYFIGIEIILDYSKKSMDIEMIKKVASLEIILK